MARARVPAPATLVALLAVVAMAAATATGADNSTTICDTAKCGKGTCSEAPFDPFGYKCTCDPGWYKQIPFLSAEPCIIPNCSFSGACSFNQTLLRGIPTKPCDNVDCGQGGTCKPGDRFSYQCLCQPGFKNWLNFTFLPCIGASCIFGPDCAKLGLVNTPAAPAPAPVGNGDLY